jgi:hypothetical protein
MSGKDPKFGALLDIAKGLDQRGETTERAAEPAVNAPPSPVEPEPLPLPAPPSTTAKPKPAIIAATPAKVERKLISTRLPVDLHKRLKRYCLESERNIEDVLEELIEEHLRAEGY